MSAEVEGSILTVKIDNSPLFVKGSFALVEWKRDRVSFLPASTEEILALNISLVRTKR